MSKKRAIALVAAAAAVFPFVVAPPSFASGGTTTCHLLLAGPTPSAEIDTNNDGNPEVRVPSVTNARVCVSGGILLDSPTLTSEPCNEAGTCHRFIVDYHLSGEATASAAVCWAVDGSNRCGQTVPIRVPLDIIQGGEMCIGVDLTGGFPCAGGTALVSFS